MRLKHPTRICIVARPMSRLIALLAVLLALASGCDDLDGRGSNRKGNRQFRETRFIDAAASYEHALTKVQSEKIDYNLGLAYSRIFKGGSDEVVLLAEKGDDICSTIPGVGYVNRSVCVKIKAEEEDRGYNTCDAKAVCPSSATCKKIDLCTIENKQLAELSAKHLTLWIATQPADEDITKKVKELSAELEKLEKARDEAETAAFAARDQTTGKFKDKDAYEEAMRKKTDLDNEVKLKKEDIDETRLKFTMRTLMTNLWVDSLQYEKALAYWENELKTHPQSFEAMGKLAGINLQAGNWRKSIEWFLTIADKSPETQNKITAFSSVGNVAWSKLNSKTLGHEEAVELADLGIGALQKASELAPKNPSFLRLQSSLYNFRSLTHGSSWAAAIDRASSQDLKGLSDVVSAQAKQSAGTPAPPPPPPTPPAPPAGSKAGG
jgi:tetratricopeptide (TPR) repeat protein